MLPTLCSDNNKSSYRLIFGPGGVNVLWGVRWEGCNVRLCSVKTPLQETNKSLMMASLSITPCGVILK
ncbi:MAG: hypothetical protein II592_07730, partial [Muribaculaceae bacterium]|nr:hypothetical protein [Muribaculaceae bacterium]